MNNDMKLIVGGIIATLIIVVGGMLFIGRDDAPKRETLGTAAMTIDKKEEDLGIMKTTDEKSATFTITNTSGAILRIWGIATSCDCTFATITINGKETGEFNMPMHMIGSLKNWIGEVPGKGTALLTVIYRPKVMPVTGVVTRQVNFSTNDPKNPNIEVSIKANVL